MAGVAVAALLVGCGSEAGTDGGKPGGGSASPSSLVSPTPVKTVPIPVDGDPSVPSRTAFPDTAEGRLDKLADEKGWFVDDAKTWPSAYVKRICRGMTRVDSEGQDPQEWLSEEEDPAASPREILKAGMPELCPEWSKEALPVLEGTWYPEHTYADGTYKVAAVPGEPDPDTGEVAITPGRWRTTGDVEDCYWERTSRSGEIIDNNFATSAQEIMVTIRSSDGQFTSENCGIWKKVG